MATKIIALPALQDNYIWLIVNSEQQTSVCVDPGDAAPVVAYCREQHLRLSAILLTHHHYDHTGGVSDLVQAYSCPVYGPAESQLAFIDNPVQDNDCVTLEAVDITYTVMCTPGHTLDHIVYYRPGELFCGDTLFAAGCGRLFEGTAVQMHASLRRLAALPPSTRVYCAHEYTLSNLAFAAAVEPHNEAIQQRIREVKAIRAKGWPSLPSTLESELTTNPFLRCQQSAVIEAANNRSTSKIDDPVSIFSVIRDWKNNFV